MMSEQLKHLQELEAQLHEVNQEFARAARPLQRVSQMNGEQRDQLAGQLRAMFERWEAVTRQISQVLQSGNGNGV